MSVLATYTTKLPLRNPNFSIPVRRFIKRAELPSMAVASSNCTFGRILERSDIVDVWGRYLIGLISLEWICRSKFGPSRSICNATSQQI